MRERRAGLTPSLSASSVRGAASEQTWECVRVDYKSGVELSISAPSEISFLNSCYAATSEQKHVDPSQVRTILAHIAFSYKRSPGVFAIRFPSFSLRHDFITLSIQY